MAEAYLDACCFIYLLEGAAAFRASVATRLAKLDAGTSLLTSRLSRLECRSKPLRGADAELLRRYEAAFSMARVAEISPAVIEKATELRATHGFRAPDAIHLATAIEAGAAVFLTGDSTLARCRDVPVEVLSAQPVQ